MATNGNHLAFDGDAFGTEVTAKKLLLVLFLLATSTSIVLALLLWLANSQVDSGHLSGAPADPGAESGSGWEPGSGGRSTASPIPSPTASAADDTDNGTGTGAGRGIGQISEPGIAITIAGDAETELEPGTTSDIDLSFTNASSGPAVLTAIRVVIVSITAPHATPAFGCGTADYSITQLADSLKVRIPAGSSTLSSLGSPRPTISMLNTGLNQNGCKNATVNLAYSGTGS